VNSQHTFKRVPQQTFAWIAHYTNPDLENEPIEEIKINEVVDRNLILREKKLALGLSDKLIVGFKDEPEKLLEHTKSLNLQKRDLKFADFFNSELTKADLRKAKLQGARLDDAQLQGADLYGAQLGKVRLTKKEDLERWAKEIPDPKMRESFQKSMHKATQQETRCGKLSETLKVRHSCKKGIEGCGPLLKIPSLSKQEILKLQKNIYRDLICKYPVLVDVQLKNEDIFRDIFRDFVLTNDEVKVAQKVCEKKAVKK
jgi:hypothetical protein